MRYELNLNPQPFEAIKQGRKKVEMRVVSPLRQHMSPGDEILFTNTKSGEMMFAMITEVHFFSNFVELYAHYPDKIILGYQRDEKASPDDMLVYYAKEKIRQNGVMAIHLQVMNK